MKMRGLLVIAGILVFLAGCGKSGGDDKFKFDCSGYVTMDFETISMPDGIEAFTVAEDGTIFCSAADEKLYAYEKDGGEKKELPAASFYGNLCADGDAIYAYDYKQSAIVKLTADGEFSEENVRVIQNGIAFHTIRNMVAVDGRLYVLAIPFTAENAETFPAFGASEFEYFGETVYCVDAQSGQYSTLNLGNVIAEYRTEDGRLFFYGWQEDKYFLCEYDTKKEKMINKLSFDSMKNLFNMIVEGGYLFATDASGKMFSINLETGEKQEWTEGIFAMFGNDLQFYRGNLFVNDAIAKEIKQLLIIGADGGLDEPEQTAADNGNTLEVPPMEWTQRTDRIGVSTSSFSLPFDSDTIKRLTGMRTKKIDTSLDPDAVVTELMAGNSDVDIYIFTGGDPVTQRIKELGLYVPLNDSKIIADHLGRCFDYIEEAATAENGDIWMLPLYEYNIVTWYIPENMEKFHVSTEELSTIDGYLAVLERLQNNMGDYRYYNQAAVFMNMFDIIYDVNYNDYQTKKVNFDTELYRRYADFFWTGWDRYAAAESNHPLFFNVAQQLDGAEHVGGETPDFDRDTVIFKTNYVHEHLCPEFGVGTERYKEFLEGWRAMPFPKLENEQEDNIIYLYYAYVNPYSTRKEAAIEYLEVIASDQAAITQLPIFFREDIGYYEDLYDTSMPAFLDLYEIFKNSAVYYRYSWDLSDEYITDYQRGLITFDEAIERRQKRAVTGLYE